jgi:hypothetical protein
MTTDQHVAPRTERLGPHRPEPAPGRDGSGAVVPLPDALRQVAQRRRSRAAALRDWSQEVRPVLGRSLLRRAAELELGAVALELRADGIEGVASVSEPVAEQEVHA